MLYDGLKPYQCEGVDFLSDRAAAGLFDDPRLGKAVQSIRAADAVFAYNILVLCQAVAKVNWQREFQRWGLLKRTTATVDGRDAVIGPENVICCNYDLIAPRQVRKNAPLDRRIFDQLRGRVWDLIIVDEADLLKNAESGRTQAVYGPQTNRKNGLVSNAWRVWLLTGTPMPSDPSELWPHLFALAGPLIDNATFGRFVETYCECVENDYGFKIVGGRNPEQLKAAIAPFMLRRTKAEVFGEMRTEWEDVTLPADGAAGVALKAMEESAAGLALAELLRHREPTQEELDAYEHHLATHRRMVGLAKVALIAEVIAADLRAGLPNIVLFAQHTDVINELCRALEEFGVVKIDGSVRDTATKKARTAAIDKFQSGGARVTVGQLQAASTSISLAAADDIALVELSWVPRDNSQAIERIWLIDKTTPLRVRTFSLAGSLDEAVTAVLRRKTKMICSIFN